MCGSSLFYRKQSETSGACMIQLKLRLTRSCGCLGKHRQPQTLKKEKTGFGSEIQTKQSGGRAVSHSQNSMGYMVVLCIILYIVGVSIYLFVKFVRKKLDEARDRRFQREHQGSPMSEMKTEDPSEKQIHS